MIFKNYEFKLALRIVLLAMNIALTAYLIFIRSDFMYFAVIVFLYQVVELFNNQKRIYRELDDFSEAVFYRDFTRNFNIEQSPAELQPLRKSFNLITDIIKIISREKETQHNYLQHVLEVVGTGIISFDVESGEITWMNNALKNMLNLPHYKNIHTIEKRNKRFFGELIQIKAGDSRIFTTHSNKQNVKLLISATMFQIENKKFKLVTLQNINQAIDETEADAWSRLLGVMTHEIMNSIAPISSLANTLKDRLQSSTENNEVQPSYRADLEVGIDTIRNRSEALLKFAETYRNLSRIKSLVLKDVLVRDLFENLHSLMMPTLSERNIDFEIVLKDPYLKIRADSNLIEQVLINLILNAMEAVKNSEQPRITLSASSDEQKKCVLKVADNGHGIDPLILDQIFIPFFSTKKNGTGIGLNLCKQIILLHKGNIYVNTVEGKGTSFSMVLT